MSNNERNEFPLTTGLEDQSKRQTARHIPSFFRTDKNKKFLGGTLDPLTQPGKLDRINAYVGRKDIVNYAFDDNYLDERSTQRQYYQLEPSFSYQDPVTSEVRWYSDYIDYVNSLRYFGAPVANHSRLNKQEAYAWDPHIDWDKFVNYREYYWLPNGPDPVTVYGELEAVTSTYNITIQQQGDNSTFLFSTGDATTASVSNPRLTLYRGIKYKFIIDATGKAFSIKNAVSLSDGTFYNIGVSEQKISQGILTFEVPQEAPELLYYLDNNDINTVGTIDIKDIGEALVLNVESEIVGKRTYSSSSGVEFVNGLKLRFSGQVTPAKYASGFWYVEGVGTKIKLIPYAELETPAIYGSNFDLPFDDQPFDSVPWDSALNHPLEKDYIIINRASRDRNTWSRSNRWFSRSAIETTATANGQIAILDQTQRAQRPIIEFVPDIKLNQYGWQYKNDVDFVDLQTTDVFSTIEGSTGYLMDGNNRLYPGHRILFLADTDSLVYGKIFEVKKIVNGNTSTTQLTLQPTEDSEPIEGDVVYITQGDTKKGKSYYYQNGVWSLAQAKTSINQAPLFDLFDESKISFSDTTAYTHTTFKGNRLFGYKIGTGTNDTALGFPLSYLNISNIGDIEFEFDLETQSWTYQSPNSVTNFDTVITLNSSSGFLRRFNDNGSFSYINGWTRTVRDLDQSVTRILRITGSTTDLISIDVYDNSVSLTDLKIKVYVNDKKIESSKLTLEKIGNLAYIRFSYFLADGDKVVYKVRSLADKNLRGYYEIPLNWQNNPLNDSVSTFTFGEVTDHVRTIVEEVPNFTGSFPGISNLSNIGTTTPYGKRFLQHAGSMPMASFLMTDEHANIVRALRWSAKKYAEFKKEFLRIAQTTAFDGNITEIVDQILLQYSKSRQVDTTPFYFSDMVPYGAFTFREYIVKDPRLPVFVIDSIFDPKGKTKRSILVYKNDIQLLYGIDYNFETADAFVNIVTPLVIGDRITIKDYPSTDGCYVPSTPSKLGLYPQYVPELYIDDTYRDAIPVIQGHDGSIIKAYNDYRDDLILELEKRIYNTSRVEYDISIFNIHSVIGSYYSRGDFTKTEINDIMLVDFLSWNSIIDQDFTSNNFFTEEEPFTYNYGRSLAPNETDSLPGFWRGIYKYFYDTDRPHTHPWEMQGFSIKPTWWETVYGVAPYTSENKILWDSIEQGIVRDPAGRRTILRYKRPGLSGYLPVDATGKLLSPIESNLAKQFSLINAKGTYLFGDQAPVEAAWRRSSEYPYAVMVAMCVLRGAEFIGKMWDRLSIKRNIAGQIYNSNTGKRLRPSDLIFSDVINTDNTRNQTSGLANIIEEYVFMQKYVKIDLYKTYLSGINAKLSYKIGGFTSKEKIKVLLDSRSPNASGSVFLPTENYQVFYNKSFPISTVSYSGVLIERLSSSYAGWTANTKYNKNTRVIYQKDIYRCITKHTSDNTPVEELIPNKDFSVQRFEKDAAKWEKESTYFSGYKIKGYDTEKNYFEIYPPRPTNNDPTFNVGGISESFIEWTATPAGSTTHSYYARGTIVRVDGVSYYRAKVGHSSSTSFDNDIDKWQQLGGLPIVGGRTAYRRKRFEDTTVRVPYGTIFTDIQTVVDFLFGYQKRLEELGFEFDDYSKDLNVPLDWLTSAKEFMFWTLQNWAAGAVITLSPSANLLKFKSTMSASIDGFVSDFHDYSIFKADGTPLRADLTDIYREDNGFTIRPSIESNDGIFHIRTNLVYREHVLLLDNRSIFNDVVYDVVPGYRQGRVKLLGFKTSNWDGGFTSPGFVFDEAKISNWEQNTDYPIGSVVKYKDFYYTATSKISPATEFDYEIWTKLTSAPTAKLIPNFDYKVEQFRDFYNLDASIFDSNQQTLARHLIGYQPREYLDNIIIDDVSQYKFYQGFIKEKGTFNSITKLFDALRSSGYGSVDVKEEWAFKLGDYGASDGYTEIEFPLDERAFRYNPQDIVLTSGPTEFEDLSIFNVPARMLTIKPSTYNSKPFTTAVIDQEQPDLGIFKYRVAGYVKDDDIDHILFNEAALMNYDITLLREGDKIWLGYTSNNDWDVLDYINLKTTITTWTIEGNIVYLECSKLPDVAKNDIITVTNLDALDGTYKVQKVYNNIIEIFTFNTALYHLQEDSTHGLLYKMQSVRYATAADVANRTYTRPKIRGEKIWIDKDSNGKWLVLENQDSFTESELVTNLTVKNQKYGSNIKISGDNRWLFVTAINHTGGKVAVYNRPNIVSSWTFVQTLYMPPGYLYSSGTEGFGASVDVSDDGRLLVVGVPDATDLKGRYKGDFSTFASYVPGDIVKQYNGKLWKNIYPIGASFTFDTTHWEETILTGDTTGSKSTIVINTVSRSANIATIVTDSPHNLLVGTTIAISNVSVANFNDESAIIKEILSPTSFTYDNTGSVVVDPVHVTTGRVTIPLTKQGLVVVYRLNLQKLIYDRELVIGSNDPIINERFGSKVRMVNDGLDTLLFVGSKNYNSSSGRVQIFKNTRRELVTTNTVAVGNLITVESTVTLYVGMPLVFTGNEFGSLIENKSYYVHSIESSSEITISEVKDGSVYSVTDGIGRMIMIAGEWKENEQRFIYPPVLAQSGNFAYDIDVTSSGDRIAISEPFLNEGSVYVYERSDNNYTLFETINAAALVTKTSTTPVLNLVGTDSFINANDHFGYSINITNNTLFVSCPDDDFAGDNLGSVYHFDVVSSGHYRLKQVIFPPTTLDNERFGLKLTVNPASTILAVSSGGSNVLETVFDAHVDRLVFTDAELRNYELDTNSKSSKNPTTFDAGGTVFYDITAFTGAVYVYNRFDDDFVYADKLNPSGDLVSDDDFGASIVATDDCIAVGTPNRYIGNDRYGTVFTFDYTELSWAIKDTQNKLVDISKFKKAFIYNTADNTFIENLDFYDPAKGRIPHNAEQEIKYQTYRDPAVYQYGLNNTDTVVDQSNPWTDEHVGEVWWDLSRLKYTWYEQGDSTYRNNNWGRLFPGSTIDVYEWVESPYLPSRWAMMADTEAGLALGISGIPRQIDDFTYSSKFKYDAVSGNRITTYYFWVKNKATIPDIATRKMSCASVARLLYDPKSQGYKFIAVTDENSLSITNINSKLIKTDISLNLQFYEIEDIDLAVHRQYTLIAADDANAVIPYVLEQKWMDSLIGRDKFGNRVPDTSLSKRQRYGTLNSPRQSWFINRFEALKQLFEYVNTVLAANQIVDDVNLSNLNSSDPIPTLSSGKIDIKIDVIDELRFINTSRIKTAKLSVNVSDYGKIVAVGIVDPGFGYGLNKVYTTNSIGDPILWHGPTVTVYGTGEDAIVQTFVNKQGVIVQTEIKHPGSNYDKDTTTLVVRDFTVLVLNDSEARNGWSLHRRDRIKDQWFRFKTQSYDVTRYWKYVDWYATGYSSTVDIKYLVSSTYEIGQLSAQLGDIVKVNNVGYGNWLLLIRTAETNGVDYTADYTVIGRENATIEFSSILYNLNQDLGFDSNFGYSTNLYDQTPTTELRIILEALRDDILVDNLRIEYIKSFFNSVYYVLSEQLYVDWVFKTSFLKINHTVGSLRQRITFQSDVVESYQQFIEEAKPYKTKIREWVSSYGKLQQSWQIISDFDLPAYYDVSTGNIETITVNSSVINDYPWKNWLDNHTYELTDIVIHDAGKNYSTAPKVIISGGFADSKIARKFTNSNTDMSSNVVFSVLGRSTGVSTQAPMTATAPGIYATWSLSNGTITVASAGLPYHSYGNTSAVNLPMIQDLRLTIPLRAGTDDPTTIEYLVEYGLIGVWLNGVAMFNPSAANGAPAGFKNPPTGFNYNAAYESGIEIGYSFGEDTAGGHANEMGVYHYHDFNFAQAWMTGVGHVNGSNTFNGSSEVSVIPYLNGGLTHANGHSKILGWAIDGYPVYGPYGYDNPADKTSKIRRMNTGYALKDYTYRQGTEASNIYDFPLGIFVQDYQFVGTGDLDIHNGRFCVTPDYPNGTYAYFVTISVETDENGLYVSEAPVYPYVLGSTYYGTPLQSGVNLVPGKGIAPVTVPLITIDDIVARDSIVNAEATAYIANGKLYKIVVDNPGKGYVSAPTIYLSGGTADFNNDSGKAYAIIGNGRTRSNLIGIKFDRYTTDYTVDERRYQDTYTGTGAKKTFKLTYAPEIEKNKFIVIVDNIELYGPQYEIILSNVDHGSYTALEGSIVFTTAPISGANITVSYEKNIKLFSAADRIKYEYNPGSGQYGKELGQLMTGIDYGGVTLTGIDFDVSGGWDSLPWDVSSWDNVLDTNNDVVIISDGTTMEFDIGYVPNDGEIINVYIDNVRIDDPDYNGVPLLDKPNVAMASIVGDGSTKKFTLPNTIDLAVDALVTFRKSTSDGSILPTDRSVMDAFVSGGNFANTAKGILAEEIIIDGDGFITPDTSHAPEELVPGQIVDTLNLNVYSAVSDGGPNVHVQNFVGDGITGTYMLDQIPGTTSGLMVLVDGFFAEHTINFVEQTVTLTDIPANNDKVVIISIDTAATKILDKVDFIGDGSTTEFLTSARYDSGNVTVFATIDGIVAPSEAVASDSTYDAVGNVVVKFLVAPGANTLVQIMVFSGSVKTFSEVNSQYIDILPNTTEYTLTNPPVVAGPVTASTFVTVFSNLRFTVRSVARSANIATINTTTVHSLRVGDRVTINNVDNSAAGLTGFDVVDAVVLTVPNTKSFTYANQGSLVTTTSTSLYGDVVTTKQIGEFLRAPDYQNFIYDGSSMAVSSVKYKLNSLKRTNVNVYRNGTLLTSGREYIFDSSSNYVIIPSDNATIGDEITVEIVKNNDFIVEGNSLKISSKFSLIDKNQIKVTTFANHDILKVKRFEKTFSFDTGYDILTYDAVKYDTLGTAINTNGIIDLPRTISSSSGLFVAFNRRLLSPNIDYAMLENRRQIKVILPDSVGNNDYLEVITTNAETVKAAYGYKIFKDMLNRTHYKVLDKKKSTVLTREFRYFDTKIEVEDASVLEDPGGIYVNGTRSNIPGVIEIAGERIEYFIKEGNTLRQLRRGTLGTGINATVDIGATVMELGQKNSVPYTDKEYKKVYYGDNTTDTFEIDVLPIGTTSSTWHRDTIPTGYGQCDSVEVFVAGRRLRKNPIQVYDQTLGQDSYKGAGDKWIEAEFSIDGVSNSIRLTEKPASGEMIVIVYKQGKIWQKYNEDSALRYSDTDIARFVTARAVDLPK